MLTTRALPAPLRLRSSTCPVTAPFLEVSGCDASRLELGDDDLVRVDSGFGVIEWRVRVAALEPGVAVLCFGNPSTLCATGKRLVLRRETEVQVLKLGHADFIAARRSLARSS